MNSVFEANPGVEILFVFEDGNAFVRQQDADGYAKQSKSEYKIVNKEDESESSEENEETEKKQEFKKHKNQK